MKVSEALALKQLTLLNSYADDTLRLAAEKWDHPWKALVATLLSARTKDETTLDVTDILFEKYPMPRYLAKAKVKDVENIVRPVNYYKTKARRIIEGAKLLTEKYNETPPLDVEELITLPGVGRKTANVYLAEYGKPAIGVDTHVADIAFRLKWTKHTNPDKIEKDLNALFHEKRWATVNAQLVRFGRTYQRGKKRDEIIEKALQLKI